MTGYTVHTGSTEKFSSAWDRIFSGDESAPAKKSPRKAAKKSAAKAGKKKSAHKVKSNKKSKS
ncbi:MAG: hypothetical protein ACKVT0_13385 [Planctomycetaceae bacterium]